MTRSSRPRWIRFLVAWLSGLGQAASLVIRLYGRSRARLMQLADRLFVAPVRERAAIAAAEEERARLARNIHDEPLQTLSGVIRRLEVQSVAPADIEALREAAHHLREVATELNSPVLEDLGLGPAVAHLVDQTKARGAIPVGLALNDTTDFSRASRLPSEVEVALYRIVQEAVNNAESHSGASTVTVTAEISPAAAEVEVRDDGVGISASKIRQAQSGGHFGMSAMRHRADNIAASLQIGEARPSGTRVLVIWPRR